MSTFDKNFAELLRLDAARRAPKPTQSAAAVEDDDEDDDPDTIFAEDVASIDADILRSSRRYKRARDPAELTARHVLFAQRLAQGIEPTVAARTRPLSYRLRAIRSLLMTPLFVAAYEALRSERSPSVDFH